ncbi:hypothetical protein KJ742_05305 [Patescibacteria group bacterium]|nr:hypothetical protein [Patescibacteria group bacterium]MBU1683335.1 hypothetical protein [Patescibacteria group bacterium]MBU1934597.1 hypothetical protein [Patescibacteria group bacterium]
MGDHTRKKAGGGEYHIKYPGSIDPDDQGNGVSEHHVRDLTIQIIGLGLKNNVDTWPNDPSLVALRVEVAEHRSAISELLMKTDGVTIATENGIILESLNPDSINPDDGGVEEITPESPAPEEESITGIALVDDDEDSSPQLIQNAELIMQLALLDQFRDRLETLKHFNCLNVDGTVKDGDAPLPTFREAVNSFTTEELQIAKRFQKPIFLLIPETSFKTKIDIINNSGLGEVSVSPKFGKEFGNDLEDEDTGAKPKKISGWRVVIVDGAKGINPREKPYTEDTRTPVRNRIDKRKNQSGIDRDAAAMIIMEIVRNNESIDTNNTYTLLDDEPMLSAEIVLDVELNKDNLSFAFTDTNYKQPDAHFRDLVGGNIILNQL